MRDKRNKPNPNAQPHIVDIPVIYYDPATSGLTVEVVAGGSTEKQIELN
jgi:hypothetical protein